jgi:hypothetical protein
METTGQVMTDDLVALRQGLRNTLEQSEANAKARAGGRPVAAVDADAANPFEGVDDAADADPFGAEELEGFDPRAGEDPSRRGSTILSAKEVDDLQQHVQQLRQQLQARAFPSSWNRNPR